jgi:hypothetical protein
MAKLRRRIRIGRYCATWRLTAPHRPQERVCLPIWLSMIRDALFSGALHDLLECGDGGLEIGSTAKYQRRHTTAGNGALDSASIDKET